MENKKLNDGTYPLMTNGNICLGTLNYPIAIITVDGNFGLRPVINLKADVSFTGDGSYDNPYVIVTD